MQGRHSKRQEVAGLDQFRSDRRARVRGIGCVIGRPAAIGELDEAGVFDAVRLGLRYRKDDAFTDVLVRFKDDLNLVAEPGRRIDSKAAIGRDGASAKGQRRHVSFADGTQAENEA